MKGNPQPLALPESSVRRYGVFVKLWSLTPEASAPECKALFDKLDEELLSQVSETDDWFPSPYGGAVILGNVAKSLSSAKFLLESLTANGIVASVAITWGLFHRIPNVHRWNVVAIPMNMAARMASCGRGKGKVLLDTRVAALAKEAGIVPSIYRIGPAQVSAVKRTEIKFHELDEASLVLGPHWSANSAKPEQANDDVADIVCFDIEGYSQCKPERQEELVEKLSKAIDASLRSTKTSKDLFEPAGDGGYLAFKSTSQDLAAAAWQFARNLRDIAVAKGIPLRIGIHSGIVTSANHREAVGGSVIRADQVSALPNAGDLAVTEVFWDSLRGDDTFKLLFDVTRAEDDPTVLLLTPKVAPPWIWGVLETFLVVAARILAVALAVALAIGICAFIFTDYARNLCCVTPPAWRATFDDGRLGWISPRTFEVDSKVASLTLPALSWASPRFFEDHPLSDFMLRFRLSFSKAGIQPGVRAKWILRSKIPLRDSESDFSKIPGYHFELVQEKSGRLLIRGSIVSEIGKEELLDIHSEEHSIGGSDCCKAGQALEIHAMVIGHRIFHCRTLQDLNTTPGSLEVGAPMWDALHGFVSKATVDPGGIVFGTTESIELSDVVVKKPPSRELLRCFAFGRYCVKPEDPNSCP